MSADEARSLIKAYASEDSPCGPVFAAQRARIMLGCYPRGQAEDPDTYVMALAAVLAEYPEPVAKFVSDPRSGLPRTQKFLPAVAEVATACEDEKSNRDTLIRLAEQHLRMRSDEPYRLKLEAMVGYPIGREEQPENPEMIARVRALITGSAA